MLSRFYRIDGTAAAPEQEGKVPVVLVLADDDGGPTANYHGTTVLTQVLRGMWPALGAGLDAAGLYRVAAVKPDDRDDLERVFRERGHGDEAFAGFLHELVLMNYGGRRLDPAFVQRAYALCAEGDVPTLCDEIQSCLWAPGLFLFKEYGIDPDFVVVGKGFPGGEYAASRIVFRSRFDVLPQFGALVTNGQEELAALAYLVTMTWAEQNAGFIDGVGRYYQERLAELASSHPDALAGHDGDRHMGALVFRELEAAKAFAARVDAAGIDISAQTYKADCPPVALTKLPLVADRAVVDLVVARMAEALAS